MLIYFVYDTTSLTIFNDENTTIPNYEKNVLGKTVIDLNPLHMSRELRWVRTKLKRLGYKNVERVIDKIAHGLRTKNHVVIELFT